MSLVDDSGFGVVTDLDIHIRTASNTEATPKQTELSPAEPMEAKHWDGKGVQCEKCWSCKMEEADSIWECEVCGWVLDLRPKPHVNVGNTSHNVRTPLDQSTEEDKND